MAMIIWGLVVPTCSVGLWLISGPVRQYLAERKTNHARMLFHRQREWLEARFLTSLGRDRPQDVERWAEADWHDEVLWARDRRTRLLVALVGVEFPSARAACSTPHAPALSQATAIFVFRNGRWVSEGRWMDRMPPRDAFIAYQSHESDPAE